MFLDEISLRVTAGSGGNGCVHFATRKYQPFGGPDGGDGGAGGDAVLVGERNLDSLDHLRSQRLKASNGEPGAGNLMIGARGSDQELAVPLGTIAIGARLEDELGAVTASGRRLVLAKGGRGGKGNTHYTTGGRRAPKVAEEGKAGQELDVLLRYRIFGDTVLLEPLIEHPALLLPQLLERSYGDVNWSIYCSRPRWVRHEHDYTRHDVVYLPHDFTDDASLSAPLMAHTYWAQVLVVNMLPLEEIAAECWPIMAMELREMELRRCQRIVVLAHEELFAPWGMDTEEDHAHVECHVVAASDSMAALTAQLTGGIVE